MAAEVLKEFLARLGFQVDEAGLQKFSSSLATATARAAAFGVGVMAAAAGIYAGIYKIAEHNAELLSTAESLGMSVAKLRELNFVASMTGSSSEALKSSLQGLKGAMAGALIGQGGLAAFARLGINIKDAKGHLRDTADVLAEVGQKIKGMDRPKAEMFLGQLGIDKGLYKMLTQDVSGLTNAYREMYAATGMDAQKAAEQSRGFIQETKMLKTVLGLLAESAGIAFIGKMGADVARFRKLLMENFSKIVNVLQAFIGMILRVAAFFGALTIRLFQWIGGIVDWFTKLDKSTQAIILGVLGFAAAWKYLNLSFLATPLGAIITGIIALVALIDDFMTYLEGGESLIDWGPWADSIMAVVAALRPLLDALGQVWDMVKGPLMEGFRNFGQDVLAILGDVLGAIVAFITAVVRLFQGDFSGAIDAVLKVFQRLADIVNLVAGRIGEFLSRSWDMVKGLVGGGESNQQSGPPALVPSPAFAVAAVGAGAAGKTELNASTVINIEGAGDPEAVGRAVGGQQSRVNADLVRHARGAAR